jgi:hypothetical protein
MSRSVPDIESEIAAIKAANPHWLTDIGDKALIAALTNEKNNSNSEFHPSFHPTYSPSF